MPLPPPPPPPLSPSPSGSLVSHELTPSPPRTRTCARRHLVRLDRHGRERQRRDGGRGEQCALRRRVGAVLAQWRRLGPHEWRRARGRARRCRGGALSGSRERSRGGGGGGVVSFQPLYALVSCACLLTYRHLCSFPLPASLTHLALTNTRNALVVTTHMPARRTVARITPSQPPRARAPAERRGRRPRSSWSALGPPRASESRAMPLPTLGEGRTDTVR